MRWIPRALILELEICIRFFAIHPTTLLEQISENCDYDSQRKWEISIKSRDGNRCNIL